MADKVVVYGEAEGGGITTSTAELLAVGSRLSRESSAELVAVFINGSNETGAEAIARGADAVISVQIPQLGEYEPELYLPVMEMFCRKTNPALVLFAHNHQGADLACRLAFRLGTGPITDCTALAIDQNTGRLRGTRSTYGGNIRATFSSASGAQIVSVREKVFEPLERDGARKGEITCFLPEVELPVPRARCLKRVVAEYAGKRLEDAEIIVSGGRGMESMDNFAQLTELAELLDGAVGGSRPTVEKGWVEQRFQVGLTGVKVSPKLYIAVGISGAVQHIAGAIGAKTIVAINKDAGANIFNEAHYGVVGDFKEVLPAFKECLREHLGRK
ncbi:MAG: electron transfer flavoprotein subunit alpha/FixB family protein [Desulfuromonadaceae bacterium]|nr:electron transfer flavoprotein subunit alpha/FixB family protein [Desulfuromonadaceae bacterium]